MSWDLTLWFMIFSTIAVNLSILMLIEPMRKRLNARYLDAKNKVERKHVEDKQFYYVYEARSRWEHEVVMGSLLGIGALFAAICIFSYVSNPTSVGTFLWVVFATSLMFSLNAPPFAYQFYLAKNIQILAVSDEWLEAWRVLGEDVQNTDQIIWSEIDDVTLLDQNYGDLFFVPWLFPRFFPRNYVIVMKAGTWDVKADAMWPNAMRLLDDAIRRCPSSSKWYRSEEMRNEVEKWKTGC